MVFVKVLGISITIIKYIQARNQDLSEECWELLGGGDMWAVKSESEIANVYGVLGHVPQENLGRIGVYFARFHGGESIQSYQQKK